MGFYAVTRIKIPRIITLDLTERQGWTGPKVKSFVTGFKRAILTSREMPDPTWPEYEIRGFRFGENVVLFALLHNLDTDNIYRAGIYYGFDHPGIANNRSKRAKAIFEITTN